MYRIYFDILTKMHLPVWPFRAMMQLLLLYVNDKKFYCNKSLNTSRFDDILILCRFCKSRHNNIYRTNTTLSWRYILLNWLGRLTSSRFTSYVDTTLSSHLLNDFVNVDLSTCNTTYCKSFDENKDILATSRVI